MSRMRQRPRRVAVGVVLALTVLGAVGWLVWGSSVMAVESVVVEGVDDDDQQVVLDAAAVPFGEPLARVDVGATAERVREVPFVADVGVTRSWPRTIVVSVTLREALFAVRTGTGLGLVDDAGVVFRAVDTVPSDLVVVNSTDGRASTPAPEGLQAVAAMLGVLPEDLRTTITQITVSSAGMVTFRLGEVDVAWGGPGDETTKLTVLKALLATEPSFIDVSVPDTPVTR